MLAIEHVSKSYGSHRVLDDVDFEVRRGELLGYVGSNGAGKTTSMRIMLGLATADHGRVTLDGQRVDDDVRARIGYMPEERGLYPTMRIQQQLRFFAELRGVAKKNAIEASLYWLDRLGLGERRGDRLEDLSLGNQQRVQLAAALIHAPDVLVLDEPFSGLDPLAVDVMTEVLLEEVERGIPVIFSSHQLDLVERICDRVAILRAGRIVAEGRVAELTSGDSVRHAVRCSAPPHMWIPELERELQAADLVDHMDGDTAILRIGTTDLQRAINVIRHRGELLEITPWRPTLSQIYRDVVDIDPTGRDHKPRTGGDESHHGSSHDETQKENVA